MLEFGLYRRPIDVTTPDAKYEMFEPGPLRLRVIVTWTLPCAQWMASFVIWFDGLPYRLRQHVRDVSNTQLMADFLKGDTAPNGE